MWLLFQFQMMIAPTPSRPTKWPGCTATWTSSIRAGSPRRNRLLLRLPPRLWLGPPPLSSWSGFHPSTGTSLKGDHALLCTLAWSWTGREEIGEKTGAALQERSFIICCAQAGLRLFLKLVPIEKVIDLFSALPFSACSTRLRAIDLLCKGQIFFHTLWEEFSINNFSPVIPAVIAPHKYLWASALPACSPSSSCTFLLQEHGESCSSPRDNTEVLSSGISQGREVAGPGDKCCLFPELQVWDGSWIKHPKPLRIYCAGVTLLHPK